MPYYLDMPIKLSDTITKHYDLIVPDIFPPDSNPAKNPLLVSIHGGAWRGGEKRIFNSLERFIRRGFAMLNISYRFVQEDPFPAQLIDCKLAIRWARAHAEQYGYNADKIIVGGASAGGHLAALLAMTNGDKRYDVGEYLEYSSDVQAVVDEFGPVDLLGDDIPGLSALMGDTPEARREASPMHLITGNEPPFLIMHGTKDATVPYDQSVRFYEALKAAGVDVTFHTVPGGAHGYDDIDAYRVLTDFILSQAQQ